MLKNKKFVFLITGILLILITFSCILIDFHLTCSNYEEPDSPNISASIEGENNILISNISRNIEFSDFGVVHIEDFLEIVNNYNNPITSIYIGIPSAKSDDLIYYKGLKDDKTSSLLVERSSYIRNGYEMIAIYFDSPLLPGQVRTVYFVQTYKEMLSYQYYQTNQYILYSAPVYPILPYRSEGEVIALITVPDTATTITPVPWGNVSGNTILYDLSDKATYLDPFAENLGSEQNTSIYYVEDSFTKLEINEINREILISPWGIIQVTEYFEIQNYGQVPYSSIPLTLPAFATAVSLNDDLGEILGTSIRNNVLTIDLTKNRAILQPNTKFKFILSYYLPFENYVSRNWFQDSILLDILTTTYNFLGKKQTITITIDGCFSLDSNTLAPDAIQITQGMTKIIYQSEYVSPIETKLIQFTFTIDLFDLILRPLILMLLIFSLTTLFVIISKSRKRKVDTSFIQKEMIPVHEIREYCSLYEEKNALIYEIRSAEEDTKKKKLAKKNYKNILNKNTAKIEEIESEIIPFKKLIMEANPTFEKLVKRLDELDAERISVKDSLDLLDARYKRGKLPSKAAYMKLLDDFIRRRRKIDRSLDKTIQQLRSYLL